MGYTFSGLLRRNACERVPCHELDPDALEVEPAPVAAGCPVLSST